MNTVIFDLDGTLALIDHRKHLVQKDIAAKRWLDKLDPVQAVEVMREVLFDKTAALRHFEEKSNWKQQWDDFYDQCIHDEPNKPVVAALHAHRNAGNQIVIFSGRSKRVESLTRDWLSKHSIPYDALIMRPDGDNTPDDVLKSTWLDKYFPAFSKVLCVYDDRDKVVAMWRKRGIPCFQVANGDF